MAWRAGTPHHKGELRLATTTTRRKVLALVLGPMLRLVARAAAGGHARALPTKASSEVRQTTYVCIEIEREDNAATSSITRRLLSSSAAAAATFFFSFSLAVAEGQAASSYVASTGKKMGVD